MDINYKLFNFGSIYQLPYMYNQVNTMNDMSTIEEKYHRIAKVIDIYFSFHRNVINEAITTSRTGTLTTTETEPQQDNSPEKEGIELTKERVDEIQRNRLKSNNKKKIAHGKICCVSCEDDNGNTMKGFLVVFKYYLMKLTLGPFQSKEIAGKVRVDFRNELFNLKLTKTNFKGIIDSCYDKYNKDMNDTYGKLYVIYKNDK